MTGRPLHSYGLDEIIISIVKTLQIEGYGVKFIGFLVVGLCFCWFVGFFVSWCLGFSVSRFLGFLASWFRGFKESWFLGF